MSIVDAKFIFLFIALVADKVYCDDCSSNGDILKDHLAVASKWCNELGSYMIIDEVSDDGTLKGRYNSKVGEAYSEYLLAGRYGAGNTLGWAVSFKNEHTPCGTSTTAWSGQLQLCEVDGALTPTILTTWVLTSQTLPKDNWESTLTSKDTFYLVPPGTVCPVRQPCQAILSRKTHDEM